MDDQNLQLPKDEYPLAGRREQLRLDRRILLDSSFGLKPEHLEAMGQRAMAIAVDSSSTKRETNAATKNILAMLKIMAERENQLENKELRIMLQQTVVNVDQQTISPQQEIAAMDATILPPSILYNKINKSSGNGNGKSKQ